MTELRCAYLEMVEEVFARLKGLQMSGDDVEMYIATFENLMRQARRGRERHPEDRSPVYYFRQSLPIDIEQSIMERETIPDILMSGNRPLEGK
jgi:hypothetical protein